MFQHWEQMLLVVFFVRQAPALSSTPTVVTIVGNGAELLLCLGYHPWWWNLLHLFLSDPTYRSSARPWAQGTYLLQILLHHEGRCSLAGVEAGNAQTQRKRRDREGCRQVFFTRVLCARSELFSSSSLVAPIFLAALAFPLGISSDICTQVVKEVVQRAKKKKKIFIFFPSKSKYFLNKIFWTKQKTNQPTKTTTTKPTPTKTKNKSESPPNPKPTISFVCKFPGGSGGSLTKTFLCDSFLGSSLLSMETCPQQILYYFLTCLQGGVPFVNWGKGGACFSFDTPTSAIREGSRWQFHLENSDKNCTGASLPSPAGDVSDAACSCCWKWPDQRNVSWRVNTHQQAMSMSWGQLPEWLVTQRLLRQDFKKVLGNLLYLKRSHNITGRNEGGM